MLGSFNNWKNIQFTNKVTTNDYFDAVHKVVLDVISDNMSALFHNGKSGAINAAYPTTMGYYFVKILSELYTLQDEKNFDKKVIKKFEIIVKV